MMRYSVLAGLYLLTACAAEPGGDRMFDYRVHVFDDRGIDVDGAELTVGGQRLGTSDSKGALDLSLLGRAGDVVALELKCPSSIRTETRELRLQQLKQERHGAPLLIEMVCPREEREMAVVVSTAKPGVDVYFDGEWTSQTNAKGVAHFVATSEPGTHHEVAMDISSHPSLRPQRPVFSLTTLDSDAIYRVEQSFVKPVVKRRKKKKVARPELPQPMKRHR